MHQLQNSCIFTPIENWTHVYMNLFTQNSPYYHLLKYLLFFLKHPVYIYIYVCVCVCKHNRLYCEWYINLNVVHGQNTEYLISKKAVSRELWIVFMWTRVPECSYCCVRVSIGVHVLRRLILFFSGEVSQFYPQHTLLGLAKKHIGIEVCILNGTNVPFTPLPTQIISHPGCVMSWPIIELDGLELWLTLWSRGP
jgi:hypothetical protein